LSKRLASAQQLLGEAAQQICSRSTSTELAQVVLVGPPNVGKSSLFNALMEWSGADGDSGRRTARPALVSPQRGTTRDYLTATIDLRGIRCELIDTAGVDETISSAVEPSYLDSQIQIDALAQTLAARRRNQGTIRICCVEAGANSQLAVEIDSKCDIVALTKSDLHSPSPPPYDRLEHSAPVIVTSSRTGEGLDELRAACRRMLTTDAMAVRTQVVGVTAERCRESIRLAEEAIRHAIEVAAAYGGDELVSADLRTALSELGKVVGAVYTDDLLDRIFSSFCIGK
jgi:tRNA modification GTPase